MKKAKILIVNEKKQTVALIEGVLKKHGYEVFTAYNGVQGLERAKSVRPDLIILDVKLPLLNGYEVSNRLKQDDTLPEIPIIMLAPKKKDLEKADAGNGATAMGIKARLYGYETGAMEFLHKPVHIKDLLKRVKFILWSGGYE